VLTLADAGVRVSIVNRTFGRADAIARIVPDAEALWPDDPAVALRLAEGRIVVNATSLGLHSGDPSPLPSGARLHPDAVAIDLIYGRNTAFLQQARQAGCRTSDGVEMLVRQGAASFQLWTGIEPDLEVMRTACRRQLEEVQVC
jgi:shikimate dehydrogenase